MAKPNRNGTGSMPVLKSFMSEHTAEYALIPEIVRVLSRVCTKVVPIWHSAGREGNSTALKSMIGKEIKVIYVFPRRPRVSHRKIGCVLMKINKELVEFDSHSTKYGCPVVMGMPLASSLNEFFLEPESLWVGLKEESQSFDDLIVSFSKSGKIFKNELNADRILVHTPKSLEKLLDSAVLKPWPLWEMENSMLRSILQGGRGFPFSATYKPIAMICFNEQTKDCSTVGVA